jgi:hypothetical protein
MMDAKQVIKYKAFALLADQADQETHNHMSQMIDSFLVRIELSFLNASYKRSIRIRDRDTIIPSQKGEFSFGEMGGAILQSAFRLGYLDLIKARERTWTLSDAGRKRIANHPSIVDFKLMLLKVSNDG